MSEKSKTRLYILTCIACVAWLAQAVNEYVHDGTLLTAPSLIFLACILVAVGYTGYYAFQGWRADMNAQQEDDDAEDPIEED